MRIRENIGLLDLEGNDGTVLRVFENHKEVLEAELKDTLSVEVLIDEVGEFMFSYSDIKLLN